MGTTIFGFTYLALGFFNIIWAILALIYVNKLGEEFGERFVVCLTFSFEFCVILWLFLLGLIVLPIKLWNVAKGFVFPKNGLTRKQRQLVILGIQKITKKTSTNSIELNETLSLRENPVI